MLHGGPQAQRIVGKRCQRGAFWQTLAELKTPRPAEAAYVPIRELHCPGIHAVDQCAGPVERTARVSAARISAGRGTGRTTANDYSKPETWLCRPGRKDSCAVDLSTTIVAPSGKFKKESFKAARNAPIDCFYVYPTVSLDQTGNSDMTAGPEEHGVILQQFARFSSVCRVYAPLYRQVTLTALRSVIAGKPMPVDRMLAYNDVLDAWNYYLKNDNAGRGVVLIGHSQGSGVLTQLIRNEIDGKPVQEQDRSPRCCSARTCPSRRARTSARFQNIPLCKSASQIGCASRTRRFRDTVPPPANSRFGKAQGENMAAACVNPAALGGGSGQLHAYLSNGRFIASSARRAEAVGHAGAARSRRRSSASRDC